MPVAGGTKKQKETLAGSGLLLFLVTEITILQYNEWVTSEIRTGSGAA